MSVLAEIVARKRQDVAVRMAQTPLAGLRQRAVPTTRRLGEALRKPGLRFILECKKASPSEGLLRGDFDAGVIAETYRDFADGISVLTDTPYFQGGFADLEAVRAVAPQPVLCKDFVIDPYQIVEARAHGADAVLLMLSVLDDVAYRRCAETAAALAMDVLTEVHDEAELERALALDARIIGINNRDLKTLRIDLTTTQRLAPAVPRDRVIVCESGIRSRADIDAVAAHVDAFLVGSRLMKEARLDLAARALIFGRVKICGLTSGEDLQAAYEAGAVLGGMIFAPESPRCIDEATACAMAENTPLLLVGVFVNDEASRIARLARTLRLAAVQLHGEETRAFVEALRPRLPDGCEIWKAVRVQGRIPALADTGADRLLLDAFDPQQRGGSGKRFDWSLVENCADRSRLIVAGGIAPDNVRAAHALGGYALDVNSGVESSPGHKDRALMQQLFARLRGMS